MGASKFHAWMLERFDFATETRGETLFADHVVLDMTKICQSAARRCKNPRDAVKRVLGRVESLFAAPRVASAHSVAARAPSPLLLAARWRKLASARLRRLKSKDGARADGVVAPGAGGDARPRGYDAQGFRAVFVSDAAVPGDGELKCLEYVAALAEAAAAPEDVVVYGGDADMVVMALCRACDGDDTFGPGLRSLVVMNDVGRVYDVGELVEALTASAEGRGDRSRRQLALDFACLALVAGGNDYLPPLSVASDELWGAYVEGLRPLYDEASGRVDGAVLASLLEDRHDAETIELKRRRVVEDARSHARTACGGPPRAVEVTLVRRADRVAVRVLTPKDFGAVASGAETLTYRVQWRRPGAGWRDAAAAAAPLVGVPGDAVASRVEIFVDAGSGPLEVRCRAANCTGYGRSRTTKVRRDPAWCVAVCPRGTKCDEPACVHAHELGQLAEDWPTPAGDACPACPPPGLRPEEDDGSSSASTEPDADGAAWDEAEWLASLEWCLGAYVRGHVRDSSVRYARPAAPPPEAVIAHAARGGVSEPGGARDEPWVPPLKPLEALACLLPGKQCARLLPPNLRPVFDDGSGAEDAWFGAAPSPDFAKVAAALETPTRRRRRGSPGAAAAPPHELPEPITLGPIYRDGAPMAFPRPTRARGAGGRAGGRGADRLRAAPAAKGACEPADRPRCRFASPAGCAAAPTAAARAADDDGDDASSASGDEAGARLSLVYDVAVGDRVVADVPHKTVRVGRPGQVAALAGRRGDAGRARVDFGGGALYNYVVGQQCHRAPLVEGRDDVVLGDKVTDAASGGSGVVVGLAPGDGEVWVSDGRRRFKAQAKHLAHAPLAGGLAKGDQVVARGLRARGARTPPSPRHDARNDVIRAKVDYEDVRAGDLGVVLGPCDRAMPGRDLRVCVLWRRTRAKNNWQPGKHVELAAPR
ncbi:serine/threonine kinase [Aureococcus anophagefferens]|nr:serine/threonine kinase [Aureococcus anophagefferens]